jgi:hypothetical protein
MAIVRSRWTTAPVPLDGMLPAAEWAGSGVLPIPGGFLMVKNDSNNVYVALDMVSDTGNDISTNDYFWFVIDSDNNSAVTPSRDVLYSPWPAQPNRLGKWLMAAPNATFPASTGQVIASSTRVGFGTSPNSAANHRMWEIRFSLAELGITIDPTAPPPVLRFGIRVVSSTPAFTFDFPANPLSAFNNFHQIILATGVDPIYPPGTAGVVIGGVGWIPTTKIGADGYATITDPYRIRPDEAACSGTIDLIGNTVTWNALWAAGARKYRVMHRFGNTTAAVNAAPWMPIRQSWSNYRWTGLTYVWEGFAPDSSDMYTLVNPALDYSIKALLFQWASTGEPNNLHQFKIEFFSGATPPAPVASAAQIVTLRLDNNLPEVRIVDVRHNGASVSPCAIENMTDASDGVNFVFTAFDPEGSLHSYALGAEFGAGESALIASDSYPPHRTPSHIWQGVSNLTVPAAPAEWVPPRTCGYLFRITAWARVTNGYIYPLSAVSDFRTVTLVKPGPKITLKPSPPASNLLPYGFTEPDKFAEGVEPDKLGAETLGKS